VNAPLPEGSAPDFQLPEAYGGDLRLSDILQDRIAVLAFYPSPFGSMCAVELRQLKVMYDDFVSAGAEIIGISTNSRVVMGAFRERLDIPFSQLSDVDRRVSAAYGVDSPDDSFLKGRCNRAVIVVDQLGTVRYSWVASDVPQAEEPDYDEVLERCRAITGRLTSSPALADSTP